MTLAATGDDEAALLSLLRQDFPHVSAERLLSGSRAGVVSGRMPTAKALPHLLCTPRKVQRSRALQQTNVQCQRAVHCLGFLGQRRRQLGADIGCTGRVWRAVACLKRSCV